MPLPTQTVLSQTIKSFVTSNKEQNPEKALQDFCDFQAALILDTIKSATIVGVTSTVTVAFAPTPLVGVATQNNVVKLK